MAERLRLQKLMAEAGLGSRRACEELIRAGRVTVNGETALIGQSCDPEKDSVLLDGNPVGAPQRRIALLFYKPRGVLCTSDDPEGRKTVQSYFSEIPERLYNVGRLDLNSEGLLLMTNEGDLAFKMTHPRFGVRKTYYAVCDGKLTSEEASRLTNGVELEDGMTAHARVEFVRPTQRGDTSFLITIHEGRNRQIRRMIEAVGHKTLRLKRERFGPFTLQGLKPGEWQYLTEAEVESLRAMLDGRDERGEPEK